MNEAADEASMPPPDLGLPRRLRQLQEHLGDWHNFLDFVFGRVKPLDDLFPEQFRPPLQVIGSRFQVVAGDGSGGVLVLDRSGPGRNDVERAAVIYFDSEGGIDVLGESADDFLALVASRDQKALNFHYGESDAELVKWIRKTGIEPHASSGERLVHLGPATRQFRKQFWSAMRDANRKLQPGAKTDHTLILGKQLGDVSLGTPRADLDKRWGEPKIPSWGRDEGRSTLLYADAPVVICVDDQSNRVAEITMYAGFHRVIADDGTDLMFMPEEQVLAWLKAKGVDATVGDGKIVALAAKLQLRLRGSPSKEMRAGEAKTFQWVESVELKAAF
jgi:hypothetical protein